MTTARNRSPGLVVVGASAGGAIVIRQLLTDLPEDFEFPVAIAQHMSKEADGSWAELLDSRCSMRVKEAEDKEPLLPGTVYLAPANYHLLIESDGRATLGVGEPVNYARPSIDVLFESAAQAYAEHLIGILLTGANSDGAVGLKAIHDAGGTTLVQDPLTAEAKSMPLAGIAHVPSARILTPAGILDALLAIHFQTPKRDSS